MITLITGVPGSGKSAYTVDYLKTLMLANPERPVYQHGIRELALPHIYVKCDSPACKLCKGYSDDTLKANEWNTWAPQGALLVFDEVQHIYRPLHASARVPDSIAAFETHRHDGLDFLLITQHPNLIHANIRRLVSKHIHLSANWLKRYKLEWSECQANVQAETGAVKTSYVIPKSVYKLYKSAEIHTKVKRQIHPAVYLLGVLIPVLFISAYLFSSSKIQSKPGQSEQLSVSPALISQLAQVPKQQDFVPTILNRPESAPAYQHLVKVTDFPRLAACIASKKKCKCYSQQGTELFITRNECIDFAKTPRFNPYHVDKPETNSMPMQTAQAPKPVAPSYQPNFNVAPEHEPMYIDEGIR